MLIHALLLEPEQSKLKGRKMKINIAIFIVFIKLQK
jgi:hypothetical protein